MIRPKVAPISGITAKVETAGNRCPVLLVEEARRR